MTATSSVATAQLYLIDPLAANPPTSCNVTPLPAACIPMTLQAGVPTVILIGVPDPGTNPLTVVSSLGGSASSPVTKLRN